jgi:hypothetical protein
MEIFEKSYPNTNLDIRIKEHLDEDVKLSIDKVAFLNKCKCLDETHECCHSKT